MAKQKIEDKVKLEQIIDKYLASEIPLSIFLEEYNLTYPQQKLFINRARGYNRQTDSYINSYSDYDVLVDEIPSDNFMIPHEIDEKNPTDKETRRDQFLSLRSLEQELKVKEELLNKITDNISSKYTKIDTSNKDKCLLIKKLLEEVDRLVKVGTFKSSDYEILFKKYNVTSKDLLEYQTLYQQYQELILDEENKKSIEKEIKKIKIDIDLLKEEIALTNIKLSNWVIRTFFNSIPLPKEDTQMVALEGLIRAINSYDPNFEYEDDNKKSYVQFSTYAVKIIVQTIEKNFSTLMGISWDDYIRKEFLKDYRTNHNKNLTDEELALLVPYSVETIKKLDSIPNQVIDFTSLFSSAIDSLEESIDYKNKTFSTEDYEAYDSYEDSSSFIDEETIDFDSLIMALEDKKTIDIVLDELTPEERFVIIKRFGLDGKGAQTLKKVAQLLNCDSDKVRRVEDKAIQKLRHPKITTRLNYSNPKTNGDYFAYFTDRNNSYLEEKEHTEPLSDITDNEFFSQIEDNISKAEIYVGDSSLSALSDLNLTSVDSGIYVDSDGTCWNSIDDYNAYISNKNNKKR